MKWFKVTAAAIVATATVLTGGVAYAAETSHRYDQGQLQHDLDAIHATGVSGVLAEVDTGPRRLRGTSGVADLQAGGPINVDGYFRMGSNTKTFVSAVVLQLVGEGRLCLDDPVERWLPGVVTGNGNNGAAITVRQLLQHTSGIYDYTNDLLAQIGSVEDFQEFRFASYTPDHRSGHHVPGGPARPCGTASGCSGHH